ncbi:Uncharacterised protein [Vibrio cholerae]|nr:Uncharacterised protein [Vibrio cholerae]
MPCGTFSAQNHSHQQPHNSAPLKVVSGNNPAHAVVLFLNFPVL